MFCDEGREWIINYLAKPKIVLKNEGGFLDLFSLTVKWIKLIP